MENLRVYIIILQLTYNKTNDKLGIYGKILVPTTK